jgi:hypothetical protein
MSYLLQRSNSTKSTTQNPRCTKEYKYATDADIDNLKEFKVDTNEIKNILKSIEKNKTEKTKYETEKQNVLRQIPSNSSKLSRKQQRQRNENKRKADEFESKRKTHEDEEKNQRKTMHKLLSEQIKTKTRKRVEKLIDYPTDERLEKVACTLRALLDVLKSGDCILSSDSIRNNDKLKSKFLEEIKAKNGDVNLATSFINVILEKTPDNNADKFIRTGDNNIKSALTSTIDKIQTCSA